MIKSKYQHLYDRKGKTYEEIYNIEKAKEIKNNISKNSRKGKNLICMNCGQSFYKRNSIIGKNNFCSRECFSAYSTGKTYEEKYGNEKSKKIKEKLSFIFKGKTLDERIGKYNANIMKKKISMKLIGKKKKKCSAETKTKMSKIQKIIQNTEIVRRKKRLKRIKWIEENKNNGHQISPTFNKNACNIIDEYGKENGYKFQHAMNGGEFYIKDLGYWVDGYDKKKNTVIEYYEPFHRKQKEKDNQRKQEIQTYLNCKFIELKEWKND